MRSYNPQLVTLSGAHEFEDILSALDPEDENLIISGAYDFDIDYLNEKYPEYMGFFFAMLAKRGRKLGRKIFRGIAKKRRSRIASRKRATKRKRQEKALRIELQRQENIRAIQFEMQRRAQPKNTKNMMLIGGGSLAALLLLMKARKG